MLLRERRPRRRLLIRSGEDVRVADEGVLEELAGGRARSVLDLEGLLEEVVRVGRDVVGDGGADGGADLRRKPNQKRKEEKEEEDEPGKSPAFGSSSPRDERR